MDSNELQPGATVAGRYQIIERVASGGMSSVFRAFDKPLGRTVALKLLQPRFGDDPELRRRLQTELTAAAGLRHPNICAYYDHGDHDGAPYLVMEYVDGPSLAETTDAGRPLDPDYAVAIVQQVGQALAYAHQKGIVHRDVKPSNILIARDGHVLLSDFGLAVNTGATGQTMAGMVLGTPAYMSPEQAQGQPLDARSDIYSLGIVLYQILAGRPPFTGDSPIGVLVQHITAPPPPLRQFNPAAPERLEQVVSRAIAKRPDDRYQSVPVMLAALAPDAPPVRTGSPRPSQPTSPDASPVGAESPRPPQPTSPDAPPAGTGSPRPPQPASKGSALTRARGFLAARGATIGALLAVAAVAARAYYGSRDIPSEYQVAWTAACTAVVLAVMLLLPRGKALGVVLTAAALYAAATLMGERPHPLDDLLSAVDTVVAIALMMALVGIALAGTLFWRRRWIAGVVLLLSIGAMQVVYLRPVDAYDLPNKLLAALLIFALLAIVPLIIAAWLLLWRGRTGASAAAAGLAILLATLLIALKHHPVDSLLATPAGAPAAAGLIVAALLAMVIALRRRRRSADEGPAAAAPGSPTAGDAATDTPAPPAESTSPAPAAAPSGSPARQPAAALEHDTQLLNPYGETPLPATATLAQQAGVGAWLLVLHGEQRGQQLRLAGPKTVIGRDPGAVDAVLQDSSVSRRHAEVRFRDSQYTLLDLDSTGGTFVNGQRLARNALQLLKDRDEIRLGRINLIFVQVALSEDMSTDARQRLREFDDLWEGLSKSVRND